ncbi:MAG TPA: response regulator [Rhodocyclaceae bacterium]|nr:response regulator [Rhodocyclaceae bacterium]
MRLLIVDDSSIVRSRIARLMGAGGLGDMLIVGMAKNGVEAINMFMQARPEVVTMDLTMPEMDGVECTEAMMKLNPDVRILVVSALSDKATAIKALQKGAQGFLYKPFTDDQLLEALSELVAEV